MLRTTSSIIALLVATGAAVAQETAVCAETVRVMAQPRDGLTLLEQSVDEFESLSGAPFEIDYLNENDRRVKSQADASTIGTYNVYNVDEANVALFASSGWIVPLMDHYLAEYDFDDFDPGRIATATYDGKVWFAPIIGGGDLMVYRKVLLEAAGIEPPTTVEELRSAVEALHDPENNVYGIALSGQRGSSASTRLASAAATCTTTSTAASATSWCKHRWCSATRGRASSLKQGPS